MTIFTRAIMFFTCLSSAHFISTRVHETKHSRVMCELPHRYSMRKNSTLDFRVICLTREPARDYKGKQKSRKRIRCRKVAGETLSARKNFERTKIKSGQAKWRTTQQQKWKFNVIKQVKVSYLCNWLCHMLSNAVPFASTHLMVLNKSYYKFYKYNSFLFPFDLDLKQKKNIFDRITKRNFLLKSENSRRVKISNCRSDKYKRKFINIIFFSIFFFTLNYQRNVMWN